MQSNEKALWLAILIQSTMDLVGINLPVNKLRENKDRRSAREWFEGDGDEIGSFEWTCYVLGLHADDYRSRVFKIAATNPEQTMRMRKHESNAGKGGRPKRPAPVLGDIRRRDLATPYVEAPRPN